ncbi:hypothetical protein [Singulisphaera sp. PoT]|uniref:hypothetical protein n=1 Tax=Singulisphaera sp. PoT TaxID=3411797 RepID=UPI003BF50199
MEAVAVAKKTGPKPTPEGPREALIALKCRQAYKDWVVQYARDKRTTPSQLIDQALVFMAQSEGREAPPER